MREPLGGTYEFIILKVLVISWVKSCMSKLIKLNFKYVQYYAKYTSVWLAFKKVLLRPSHQWAYYPFQLPYLNIYFSFNSLQHANLLSLCFWLHCLLCFLLWSELNPPQGSGDTVDSLPPWEVGIWWSPAVCAHHCVCVCGSTWVAEKGLGGTVFSISRRNPGQRFCVDMWL